MTTRNRLKSLKLSAFRGASEPFSLNFELRKNLTVIYGENGSGKTTLCDALVFLAEGEVGSLKERGLGSSLHQYWPSLGKDLKDIEVALETEQGTCTGRISKSKAVFTPSTNQPRIAMLRRDLMARLTESKPADRYLAISRFIDVSSFETSEANLAKLQTDLASQIKSAGEAEGQSLGLLQRIQTGTGEKTSKDPVAWARDKAASAEIDHSAQIRALGQLITALGHFDPLPARVTDATNKIIKARDDLSEAEKSLTAVAEQAGDAATELVQVLEVGRSYLTAHGDIEVCPLCQSGEHAVGLAEAVAERLDRLQALRLAVANRARAAEDHQKAKDEAGVLAGQYDQLCRAYRQVVEGNQWPGDMPAPSTQTPERAGQLADWLAEQQAHLQAWRTLRDRLVSQRDLGNSLKQALSQYDESREKQALLKQLVSAVASTQQVCRDERLVFVDQIISEIALEVQRLYNSIHPDEGMGDVTFAFDPTKKSSLDLYMGYGDSTVPPQAYFSQSHLDTLGLCITMALALRENPMETILILDDVLGSVDEPHVERVIQMIYEESKKFRHTIVTTHYRPWREKRRWGQLAAGHLQFIELSRWHKGTGMRLGKAVPELEWLEAYLAAETPDHQTICAKAGVILEACLEFLTFQYQCKLARKRAEDYTIHEMLDSVSSALRAGLRAEIRASKADEFSELALGSVLDELKTISHARNLMGAHFRQLSFELLAEDTIRFAVAVRQLAQALCHEEDGWPDKDDSGSYWRNSGDTRRLHPLKRPN